jgi:hypothetical protein
MATLVVVVVVFFVFVFVITVYFTDVHLVNAYEGHESNCSYFFPSEALFKNPTV